MSVPGYKKVGHKSRRGRKRKVQGHTGHRKSKPAPDHRARKVAQKRRLQELRAPEIDSYDD